MKNRYLILLQSLCILLFLSAGRLSAQTTLAPGDLAITVINIDGSELIEFTLFKDVEEGTVIYFSERPIDPATDTFHASIVGDGTLTWTAPKGGILEGTKITIDNTAEVVGGGTATETSDDFTLNGSGDAVHAYQGIDVDSPTTFLYSITNRTDNWWTVGDGPFTNNSISGLPSNLTDGVNALAFTVHLDNYKYSGPTTGDAATLLAAIASEGNYTGNNDTPFTNSDGTITLPDRGDPEIDVKGNGISIANGDASPSASDDTDFGNVDTGANTGRIITLENTGTGGLSLGTDAVTISGTNAADFTITDQAPEVLIPSASSDFLVKFTPSGTGLRTATISIANDDPDESPFTFSIQGTGTTGTTGDNTFDFESNATGNGTTAVTQTVNGVTATLSYKNTSDADGNMALGAFGAGFGNGTVVILQANPKTATFSFTQAIDIVSFKTNTLIGGGSGLVESFILTPAGGANPVVIYSKTQGSDALQSIMLNWVGVTSFTITENAPSSGATWSFSSIDDIVFNIPPDNTAPTLEAAIDAVTATYNDGNTSVDVSGNFADSDAGDALSFSVEGNTASDVVNATISDNNVVLDFGIVGESDVTVRATDQEGLFAESTFKVTVNRATPTITFDNDASVSIESQPGQPSTLELMAQSDNDDPNPPAIGFTLVSGPATLDGSTLTFGDEFGTVRVRAGQAITDNYNEGAAFQNITVRRPRVTIADVEFFEFEKDDYGVREIQVSGEDLVDDVTVTASGEVEVSLTTEEAGFGATVTLLRETGGNDLAGEPVNVYVRLKGDPQEPLDTNYGITYASDEMATETSNVRVVLCEDNDDNKTDVCLIATTVTSSSISLRWKPRPNSSVGEFYEIWRYTEAPTTDDIAPGALIAGPLPTTTTSYLDDNDGEGLTPGQTYYYRVRWNGN